MVYLYKKIVNGNPYYYLRLSKKIKGKIVVRDIAYLGNDISKIESKIPSKYKKEIRKAHRNIKKFIESEYYQKKITKLKDNSYLDKKLLREIEAVKLHFNNVFLKADKRTIEETYKNFLIDFAFNTTSMEGNTITLNEVDRLLRENLTPKNRTLREINDLKNTEKVFFELLDLKDEINHELIIHIHDSLIENVDERKGYRIHDIRVFKSNFEASPSKYIRADMNILLEWFKKNKAKLHPFVLASIFHQKFEKIHPFADGNGRTGRMIMIYILLEEKYPPFSVKKSNRGDYLDALKKGDYANIEDINPKCFKPISEYLAKELTGNYWNNFLI